MELNYKSSLSRYRKYITQVRSRPLWQASFMTILSLILLIALLLLVLRPTLITISSLLGQIRTEREVEAKLDAKIASLQQAQALLTSLQNKLTYLDSSLPIQPQMALWTDAAQTLATNSGVAITDMALTDIALTPQSSTSAKLANLSPIKFLISATGTYPQLADFVATLEKLPRLAVFDSVQINYPTLTSPLTLVAKGTINFTYVQKGD